MMYHRLLAVVLLVGVLGGCGPRASEVQRRAQAAAARRELAHRASALIDADVNGDGTPDVVAALPFRQGFRIELHALVQAAGAVALETACTAEPIDGEELRPLRWLVLEGVRYVVAVARTEDPDELVETVQLVDLDAGCRTVLRERLRLPKAGARLVAPAGFEGGVQLVGDGRGLELVDRPRYVTLDGPEGTVRVLVGVRRRVLHRQGAELVLVGRDESLLDPLPARVSWRVAGGENERPELVDGDESTSFVLRPGEAGELVVATSSPLVLLEMHDGCAGAVTPQLRPYRTADATLSMASEAPEGAVALAGGRVLGDGGHSWRGLWLAAATAPSVTLTVGASDGVQCLREVRAWAPRSSLTVSARETESHFDATPTAPTR